MWNYELTCLIGQVKIWIETRILNFINLNIICKQSFHLVKYSETLSNDLLIEITHTIVVLLHSFNETVYRDVVYLISLHTE